MPSPSRRHGMGIRYSSTKLISCKKPSTTDWRSASAGFPLRNTLPRFPPSIYSFPAVSILSPLPSNSTRPSPAAPRLRGSRGRVGCRSRRPFSRREFSRPAPTSEKPDPTTAWISGWIRTMAPSAWWKSLGLRTRKNSPPCRRTGSSPAAGGSSTATESVVPASISSGPMSRTSRRYPTPAAGVGALSASMPLDSKRSGSKLRDRATPRNSPSSAVWSGHRRVA